jgi:SpoVK/Ycf46/Vps4 family AAA+-type ATPase
MYAAKLYDQSYKDVRQNELRLGKSYGAAKQWLHVHTSDGRSYAKAETYFQEKYRLVPEDRTTGTESSTASTT